MRFPNSLVLLAAVLVGTPAPAQTEQPSDPSGARRPADDQELRRWLENMIWHHRFARDEIAAATGLPSSRIDEAIRRWNITADTKPIVVPGAPLTVLPYPGGRHPRIGFLEGAINPQRETKISVFTPWDATSYVVADIPEAIWSNLGLTYLAHTHIPTIWETQDLSLPPTEWQRDGDGRLVMQRRLPNGIEFGTRVTPAVGHVRMEMWLTNGTKETLSDLRVQNCVMLRGAKGFDAQTNDNKVFRGAYAACRDRSGKHWVITAWAPADRTWANADCPCLHSDPKFPDCPPGETRHLVGWLSFYQGTDIEAELERIERLGWYGPADIQTLTGQVVDTRSGEPLAARVQVQSAGGEWHLLDAVEGTAVHYQRERPDLGNCEEIHTCFRGGAFRTELPPGQYTIRIERGKEYFPLNEQIEVGDQPIRRRFRLRRWIDMTARGWYSGDTHVHRSVDELPTVMLAEDLNVAFPLSYSVTVSNTPPTSTSESEATDSGLIRVDPTHVIYPMNTEYEIFRVGDQRHTLGAVFVLNHRRPLELGLPPVGPVAAEARQQGALLDLDKHSWPWSLMIAPVMKVDLFELANNHVWRTEFGFKNWTLDSAAEYMNLDRDEQGFTEWGWIDYGFQTYYGLVNCGLRMRVSAGTASGVHPVPLGFGRVYVHLDGEFSYERWIAGLNAGRSFVSTGPMLDVRFNGKHAGSTFTGEEGEPLSLKITGQCISRRPLKQIEVIVNGQVAETIAPANDRRAGGGFVSEINSTVVRADSFWCAVRCFEDHASGRVRFAHTNPAYVDVPNRPVRPRAAEVQFFISALERQIEHVREVLSAGAVAEYQQALDFYRSKQHKSMFKK